MTRTVDWSLAIQRALTDEETKAFLDRWASLNPHWRGAQVADVLEVLWDSDSHLDLVEPRWERLMAADDADEDAARIDCLAALVVIYIDGEYATVDEAKIASIVGRVEPK
jgi:hypothetical protein